MSYYEITGGRPLSGSLAVHGAKNSVLPILAACLLIPGQCVLHNCPDLSDVSATLDILRLLGCRADREGAYTELMYGTHYDSIRSVELWPNGFAWLLRDE